MSLKGKPFMVEVTEEGCECRTILRNWVEVEGYSEVVYQEYNTSTHNWEDSEVTPAMSRGDLERLGEAIKVALEHFL